MDFSTKIAELRSGMQTYSAATLLLITKTLEALSKHHSMHGNPHNTSAADIGLGFVRNLKTATLEVAVKGKSNNHYLTPVGAALLVEDRIGKAITAYDATGSRLINRSVVAGTVAISTNDKKGFVRVTDAGTTDPTITVGTWGSVAAHVGQSISLRYIGPNTATFSPGSGAEVEVPFGGTRQLKRGMTVTIWCVGVNKYDLIGQTVDAEP